MLIFLINSLFAAELLLDDPNFIPKYGAFFFEFISTTMHKEIEYESNGVRVEQENFKYNDYEVRLSYGLSSRFSLGIGGGYDFDREYELHFGAASTRAGEAPFQGTARGFTNPFLFFTYDFEPSSPRWTQQFHIEGNPIELKTEPGKILYHGQDILLQYRFGHSYEHGQMHGSLFSKYFGKKDYYAPGDSRLTVSEPYTEVGLELGYTYRFISPYIARLTGVFGQSSDFRLRTPEIIRSADKGTLTSIEFEFGRYFFDEYFVSVNARSHTRSYNANNEELSRNIEFEIEDQSVQVMLRTEFGP
ncbi:MAG: hypothetical protein OHK0056_22550 [Bacteriovoracaceae bacterium]